MNTIYTLHNYITNTKLWTTYNYKEIIEYLNKEDLNKYYVNITDKDGNKRYSGNEFMTRYN